MPNRSRILTVLIPALLAMTACGGGNESTRAKSQSDAIDGHGPAPRGRTMSASSEIGALDPHKVTETFSESLGDLQQCLHEGAQRIEFVGGEIGFFLKIDETGRLSHAHAELTTIGDRQTEKCMLDALRDRSWPPPEGGKTGLARNSFAFDMPNDVRAPTPWDGDRVSDTLRDLSDDLDECKSGTNGSFTATMYVGTRGEPMGVGMSPPDEDGESAVDCLTEVLLGASYPSPGSWPAKVTFTL